MSDPFMLYGRPAGCGEVFAYRRYDALVQRALSSHGDPDLLAETERAAHYMRAVGCVVWARALDNAAGVQRMRLSQIRRIRPALGRAPSIRRPADLATLRSALLRAESLGASRIASALRAQLSLAEQQG